MRVHPCYAQFAERMARDVPEGTRVWGWKEPQAIYTLPFLRAVYPRLHVIHCVRDGRDVAMSNLNSSSLRTAQKYQLHYVQTITGAGGLA